MKMKAAYLSLESGLRFHGFSPSWQENQYTGEVVFTTGMTGYYESLTDPSYAGQILVFTYPLIGNYGVPPKNRWESERIHANAVIVSEIVQEWSHHEGTMSFAKWLEDQGVAVLSGVDTRALTKNLREHGTLRGTVSTHETMHVQSPNKVHLVAKVSPSIIEEVGAGCKRVIVVDCGMKENIWRMLKELPVHLVRVPYNYDYSSEAFDGIFLSNGPGDPVDCPETVEILQKVLNKEKPIFGVCLGTQMLAMATGATTYKLKYGHRGHNQPCIHLPTKRCYITSQNHGYAIDAASLGRDWDVLFQNLNDQSVEGVQHKSLPYFAVQFHPEAAPGPTDTAWLFQEFYKML